MRPRNLVRATDLTYEFDGCPAPCRDNLFGTMDPAMEDLIAASPVYQVTAAAPPAKIMNGVDDVVIPPEQAQALYDAYLAAGAYAELVLVENAMHGFAPTDGTESDPRATRSSSRPPIGSPRRCRPSLLSQSLREAGQRR